MTFGDGRRLFAPEVVQTSTMDCGPASLKSLLEGFGVSVSYGRLREVCQTDVDGTSIDTLEEVAKQLGLDAEQVIIPPDHLLLPEAKALPAIVVVRLQGGMTHFVVVWRRHGRWLQVMDPGTGRRWMRDMDLVSELHVHRMPLPEATWRAWAESDEFRGALERRIRELGATPRETSRLVACAAADPSWRAFGTLDAAVRMVAGVVDAGGLRKGGEATRAIASIAHHAMIDSKLIRGGYWAVTGLDPSEDGEKRVLVEGAVLVRITGKHAADAALGDGGDGSEDGGDAPALSPDLVASLAETSVGPGQRLFAMLREDGLLTPVACAAALFLSSAAVVVEALLFRGMFYIGGHLGPGGQRLSAMLALLAFLTVMVLLELPVAASFMRMGRHLEARLRVAYLSKLPRLGDRYFHSRLASDMAERGHMLQMVRRLPDVGARILRSTFGLALTVAGIAWLDPRSAPIAILVALLGIVLPFAFQPLLTERDLRMRTHEGALTRFYLDALLGLVPVRAHGAERAVRRQHEELLVDWQGAGIRLQRAAVTVDGVLALSGLVLSGLLLVRHLAHAQDLAGALLLVFWALQLPALGGELAATARQYPALRNVMLRVMELLVAPEEDVAKANPPPDRLRTNRMSRARHAMAVTFDGVSARAGGHHILQDLHLSIPAGSHVAVVGPSGAGKSSFVGLLLGWHRPSQGQIVVDGVPLEGGHLARVRQEIAWVDPEVHLWNQSLLENLRYGLADDAAAPVATVLAAADLHGVLERLPDGLQTSLGEGGALVSGGEGQRVRLGRALLRQETRLVILDEPFRGLDRAQRRKLLARARRQWANATLICITHDIGETQDFERVLVIEDGRLVEDASPRDLHARPGSRYRGLHDAELSVRQGLWSSPKWRRWSLSDGRVQEHSAPLEDDDDDVMDTVLTDLPVERAPGVANAAGPSQ